MNALQSKLKVQLRTSKDMYVMDGRGALNTPWWTENTKCAEQGRFQTGDSSRVTLFKNN